MFISIFCPLARLQELEEGEPGHALSEGIVVFNGHICMFAVVIHKKGSKS